MNPGNYIVGFVEPVGYDFTTPNQATDLTDSDANPVTGYTGTINLSSGEVDNSNDAGVYQLASLGDYTWIDANNDGIQQGTEAPLAGVTVNLYADVDANGQPDSGTPLASTTTNGAGFYQFTGLVPGNYVVDFITPSGYLPTVQLNNVGNDATDSDASATTGLTGTINLTSGETDNTNDAGFYQNATLGDFVWEDTNQNGQQDGTEPGIFGVTVNLYTDNDNNGQPDNGTPIATTTTNGTGFYQFTGLTPGNYIVGFVTPTDYLPTTANNAPDGLDSDNVGGFTGTINLVSGETDNSNDAGYYRNCQLQISVTQLNPATCNLSNGSINITVSGGPTPYTYNWSDITTAPEPEDRTGLTAGTYAVTVTDAYGCTTSTSVVITQTGAPSLNAQATPVSCFGGTNGAINLTVTGGTAPYSYNWGGGILTEDRSSLAAGTYTVTVTDVYGCTTSTAVVVNQPALLTASTTRVNATCGFSNGSIDLSVNGGTAPYTYNWQPGGATTQDISGLAAGTYAVTVSDVNGCTTTAQAVINQLGLPIPTITATPVSCAGAENGTVSVSVIGGTAPYNYDWFHVAGTSNLPTLSGLAGGVYVLTITDATGCSTVTSATVNEPAPLSVSVAKTNATCGLSNGAIDITATGGTTPYNYDWSNITGSSNDPDQTGLSAGTYTVTITDANGCSTTTAVLIEQTGTPTVVAQSANVTCNGLANGTITLSVNGGTPQYTYDWAHITGTNNDGNLTGLVPGTYTVTVTDTYFCTTTTQVTITQPAVLLVSGTSTPSTCGLENGSITLNVNGGTQPYTYDWLHLTGTSNPSNLNNLAGGIYNVTVTDVNGCTTNTAVMVESFGNPTVSVSSVNVSCFGGNNGSINITASNGVSPYSYNWGGGILTEDRNNLTAGTYTVTVTDANGCTTSTSVIISQPAQLNLTTAKTNAICGQNNGSINLTVTGGVSPYQYIWQTGGMTTEDVSNLAAGIYTVTVTDANNCTATTSVTIQQLGAPVPTLTATNVSCAGANDGTINVVVNGGTGPYNYDWSHVNGVSNSQNLTNLAGGVYVLTITDANGCTVIASATVNEPAPLVVTSTKVDATCGLNNGSINVTVSGGTTPYNYDWGHIGGTSNTEDLSNLAAGTYTVTVSDANGCTTNTTITILQSGSPTVSAQVANVTCFGLNNGTITLSVNGGTAQYTYDWAHLSGTNNTGDLSGVGPGTYTVTVTDANGCTTSTSATVTEPVLLTVSGTSTPATCGIANGTVTIVVNGGTAPYNYDWLHVSGVSNSQNLSNLAGGTYNVTITDAKGCTTNTAVTVLAPGVPSVTAVQTNVNCFGGNNGSINVTVTGGTTPLTYDWAHLTGNSNPEDLNNLVAGTYCVTVSDTYGCTTSVCVTITEPSQLTASAVSTNATCDLNNGTITVSVSGGVASYAFAWSDGASVSQNRTNMAAGIYTVTVTDLNGCTKTASATVLQLGPPQAIATATPVSCNGGNDGSISLQTANGIAPYTYDWEHVSGTNNPANQSNLAAGIYRVTVTDMTGCTSVTVVTVGESSPINIAAVVTPMTCLPGSGAINITVSGGTGPYFYFWGAPLFTISEDVSGLNAGTYTVTVTDNAGCTKTASWTLTLPTPPTVTATPTQTLCFGSNTGTISLTVLNGTAPFTYDWAHIAGTNNVKDLIGLAPGTYCVTVTDANGCTATACGTVTQPAALTMTQVVTPATCGLSNGAINVTVNGGTTPYTYNWEHIPGSPNPEDVSGLSAGIYRVTVTDANGCTLLRIVGVSALPVPTASASATPVSCYGGNNGTATVSVTNGVAPVTYIWSTIPTQTTQTATNLIAGTYTVTVTDANNCTATASVTVTQPNEIQHLISATNVNCFGGNNGSISVTVTGGVAPHTFNWSISGVGNVSTVSNLTAGTYTVTTTDANNCTKVTSITITQPPVLAATATTVPTTCFGGNNGSITVTATGGTPIYTYAWTNGLPNSATVNNLSAGTYTVTVTDTKGCTTVVTAIVAQPSEIVVTTTVVPATCGLANGSVTASATGGTPGYTYVWSTQPQQTGATATNLAAGAYTVTVTDANGCTKTAVVTILQLGSPSVAMTSAAVKCFGGNDGTATATPTGGTAPYTYVWFNNAQTTSTITGLTAGTYTVTVSDANNCTATATVIVAQPSEVVVTTTVVPATCGLTNGSATASATGGTPGYTYVWCNCCPTKRSSSNNNGGTGNLRLDQWFSNGERHGWHTRLHVRLVKQSNGCNGDQPRSG